MRILTEKTLKQYAEDHADAKTAIQSWIKTVKTADWQKLDDIKQTFNSVDYVGNDRYVFNIRGNEYRIVALIIFKMKFVYIRFIGTHSEYDKINCSEI